ncbi:MAG: hypothetical protein E7047_01500 [Lentisphaerae bacterium]|nr:hypothetical protein [Lentisphaerota bacterium]
MEEANSTNQIKQPATTISVAPLKLAMPNSGKATVAEKVQPPVETPERPETVDTTLAPATPESNIAEPDNTPAPGQTPEPVDPSTVFEWDVLPPERRRRGKLRKRWPRRLARILIVLLALLAVLFLLTAEFKPAITPDAEPLQLKKEQRAQLLNSLRNSLDNNQDQAILLVTLSEQDLNTIFAIVLDKLNRSGDENSLKMAGEWQNGVFNGTASIKKLGVYFTARFTATPVWENGKLAIDVQSFKLGKLPIPQQWLDKLLAAKVMTVLEASAEYSAIMQPVKSLSFTDSGSLQIELDNNTPPPPIYADEILDNMELAPAERLNTSIEEAIAAGKDRCTVILSQAELTKLMADRAFEWETQQKRPNDPFFYGEWKNDGLHLVATYVSNAEGLKLYPRNEEDENSLLADYPGTHFNLTLIVEPSLTDRQLELKIKALKLGKIELPAGKITETVNQQLVNLEDSESYQNFLDKIITIRQLPDGNVELTLDPNKTSDMFRSAE